MLHIRFKLVHNREHLINMSKLQFLLLAMSERLRRTDGILDLPSVDLFGDQRLPISLRKGVGSPYFVQERFPNGQSGLLIEVVIPERNVNTALERVVESRDSIGGQEENTRKVLELTQENGNKCITMNVVD